MSAGKSRLTTRQELFIASYLGEAKGNATEAARMAGYAKPGQEGSRLLKNAEIHSRVSQFVERKHASADDVLAELADVAFSPWVDHIEVMARDKTGKPTKVKMDLGNKVKALELLGKYHALFTEKQQVDMDSSVRIEIVGMADEELP